MIGMHEVHVFRGTDSADTFVGGEGLNVAIYPGARAAWAVGLEGWDDSENAWWFVVPDPMPSGGPIDRLANVQRVLFDDAGVALDTMPIEPAGSAFLLYRAALGRAADAAGLGFWIGQLDAGVALADIAGAIVASDEFRGRYGNDPAAPRFIADVYENVLDRAPDAAGYAYWSGLLASGQASQAQLLVDVIQSEELTHLGMIGSVPWVHVRGLDFIPWG